MKWKDPGPGPPAGSDTRRGPPRGALPLRPAALAAGEEELGAPGGLMRLRLPLSASALGSLPVSSGCQLEEPEGPPRRFCCVVLAARRPDAPGRLSDLERPADPDKPQVTGLPFIAMATSIYSIFHYDSHSGEVNSGFRALKVQEKPH